MRIIAGTHRGRILRGPEGDATRPITDRVKVSLFNILAGSFDEAVVADCFCGTGSLGIEALSRGAARVTFAEIDGSALRRLRENLADLALLDQAVILRHDCLRKGLPPAEPQRPYSLVFLDPPYRITETAAERLWLKLDEAATAGVLDPAARIVWRHEDRVQLAVPAALAARWQLSDRRTYGSQTLTFIERAGSGLRWIESSWRIRMFGKFSVIRFAPTVFLAFLLAASVCGCREEIKPGTPPKFGGSTIFEGNSLSVAVHPSYHEVADEESEKRYEPAIEHVDVFVDGNKVDLKVSISRYYGKIGFGQSAAFDVLPSSQSVKAVLRVRYVGKLFEMTVPFEHVTRGRSREWHVPYEAVKVNPVD